MQRGTLRNVVWWTLIITGVLIGGLIVDQIPNWQLPRVKTVGDAEQIVREGLEAGSAYTRFEIIEVSVENCQIRKFVDDNNICGDDGTIRSSEKFIDLKAYELVESRSEPRPDLLGWHQLFRVEIRSRSAKQAEAVERRAEQLLTQARGEIGWGWQAAVVSTQRFLLEHPVKSLSAWERPTRCSGHSWVSPNVRVLSFKGSNIDLFRSSLRKLNEYCATNE